ncbi:hypothetical protein PoB_003334800 [Plakobranchus ocellatus]|uniref:Uncharacterized protein n=1 Tax=Plakobranchus ocellatus TaxID=259542 RepID=A0AAV4AJ89_9GAST|nr:hypothetical protein PoB_003334800 [Plakobranchus ocellatus]
MFFLHQIGWQAVQFFFCLKAKTRLWEVHIRDMIFAEDAPVATKTQERQSLLISCFCQAYRDFGLTLPACLPISKNTSCTGLAMHHQEERRISKDILYGELSSGRRSNESCDIKTVFMYTFLLRTPCSRQIKVKVQLDGTAPFSVKDVDLYNRRQVNEHKKCHKPERPKIYTVAKTDSPRLVSSATDDAALALV